MLDYKNNTVEQLQKEKDILIQDIKEVKGSTDNIFGFYDGFVELRAYEVDEILCAGERPFSALKQDEIICELRNNGITTIINLMQEHEFSRYDLHKINKEFKVINIPVMDESILTLNILYKIIHIIDNNKKTYLHCDVGEGRTDVAIGYYLHKKYAYEGSALIQKLQELKLKSRLDKPVDFILQYL